MLRFSKNTYCRLLFFCVTAIFCFYQTTAAQSGRVIKKADSSGQKASVEAKSTNAENDVQKDQSPVRISSLIVVGEVQHNFAYYKSNDIDIALKELVRTLKSSPKSVLEITKGDGKTNYKKAKERAEKETDKFVLWLGFSAKDDGYGNMYFDSVQYAVLTPKTAKVVTRGQVQPKQNGVLSSGGVLNIPKTRQSSATDLLQMKQGAREIAGILLHCGWLD